MDWEPAYVEPCVTVTATAILEDGRKLTAAIMGITMGKQMPEVIKAIRERLYEPEVWHC